MNNIQIKEHGLLFQSGMIQALKDERKQHTRRAVTAQNSICVPHVKRKDWDKLRFQEARSDARLSPLGKVGPCLYVPYGDSKVIIYPRYQIGDNIWGRETWWKPPEITSHMFEEGADTWPKCLYNLDMNSIDVDWCIEHGWEKKNSIHMNRWASRLVMPITKVNVQRIRDIDSADAIREGIFDISYYELIKKSSREQSSYLFKAISRFKSLWNGINRSRGYGWDLNPYVWVLEWDRVNV